jgi:hypothetical protein
VKQSDMQPPKHPHSILEAIEGQSHVFRYNTVPTVQPRQNVAEHIGRGILLMSLVIRELHDKVASFSNHYAYRLMVSFAIHDLAESLTGDIIGPTKNNVPEIANYEDSILEMLTNLSLYIPLSTEVIPTTVTMVDYAEGTLYCTEEYKLRNHRMKDALYNYLTALEPSIQKVEAHFTITLDCMRIILTRGWHVYNKYKE